MAYDIFWALKDTSCLVPFFDMLNNNPMISNTYTYNRRFEQFEVTCKGGISRHHEVFINYGSYGTTDTLLAYGNVPQFQSWGQLLWLIVFVLEHYCIWHQIHCTPSN